MKQVQNMLKKTSIIFFVICIFSKSAFSFPTLEGEKTPEIQELFAIAEALFHSEQNEINYLTPKILENTKFELLLEFDSQGFMPPSKVDEEIFEKNCISANTTLYWQHQPFNGLRLVVKQLEHSWRGYQFSVFVIKNTSSLKEFELEKDTSKKREIFTDNWKAPIILRHIDSGEIYVIDPGYSFDVLKEWKIYILGNLKEEPNCTIHFRPNFKKSWELLPKPVQQFVLLVDATLGDGRNEGTLQQTAGLRLEISKNWANVTYRPWAMSDSGYDFRAVVERGLLHWAGKNKNFMDVYKQIKKQYPIAENELAKYYETQFRLNKDKAKCLAQYNLDLAFRYSFRFFERQPLAEHLVKNPWND